MSLSAKAKKIKAIFLDVDGVLTDGRMGYDNSGNEIKFYHTRDGHGIKLAMRSGLIVGILSGRECEANRRRAKELGLTFCREKCHDKGIGFKELVQEYNLAYDECMYIGDDVIDIPPMRLAGISVAVADCDELVAEVADLITERRGGFGAVREAINWLLKEQGTYTEQVIDKYLKSEL